MADNILARDLMISKFETISSDMSLGVALHQLVELQDRAGEPNAVVVVDANGDYAGLLTAHLLAKSLFALWTPGEAVRGDEYALNQDLIQAVVRYLDRRVSDTLVRGVPVVAPDARLLDVIAAGCEGRIEFIPVLNARRVEGLIPVTAVFQTTAALTLTPEHEGIRFEQDD